MSHVGLHIKIVFNSLVEVLEIMTPAGNDLYTTWLTVHKNFFKIQIFACQDARILLARYFGNATTDTIEVHFGADNNRRTEIIANYGGHTGGISVQSPGECIVD
jgi:hypothetical protein